MIGPTHFHMTIQVYFMYQGTGLANLVKNLQGCDVYTLWTSHALHIVANSQGCVWPLLLYSKKISRGPIFAAVVVN